MADNRNRTEQKKDYYEANKERLLAKQKEYYEKNKAKKNAASKERQKAKADEVKDYRKKWWAENREEQLKKRKEEAAKKTPAQKKAERAVANEKYADSERRKKEQARTAAARAAREAQWTAEGLVPLKAAAVEMGITQRNIWRWSAMNKMQTTKRGNQVFVFRADIDRMKEELFSVTPAAKSNWKLKAVRTYEGFVVPDGFDLITQYHELTEYTDAFARGGNKTNKKDQEGLDFLLLVGSPGSGKSKQMKLALATRCLWIDNHASNCGLYCSVYEAKNKPVVLDDVNHFLNNNQACSLVKALTQTEKIRSVSWESTAKVLEDRKVPRQYETSSPICLIANMWTDTDADMAAIQDRATPVAFYPTAETIHNRVIELGWCDKQVIKFIGDNLQNIPQPSMREYANGQRYKRAGFDWKAKLMAIWGLT